MAFLKNCFFVIAAAFFLNFSVFAQTAPDAQDSLARGLEAYRNKDWNTAVFMLKKTVSLNLDKSPDTLYMLVLAEMNSGDYKAAVADSDIFISSYPASNYAPYVNYQKGRALYYMKEYDKSVLVLSDFCHENHESEMYASALFWIAETFYNSCRYDTARSLYEQIIKDFPSDAKVPESEYRIETIDQRKREEKLLYLLKKTGEEYLSAKESYERQLKEYQTEGLVGIQRQLKSEKDKNAALTSENEALSLKNKELQNLVDALQDKNERFEQDAEKKSMENDILFLKQKADKVENLLNGQDGSKL